MSAELRFGTINGEKRRAIILIDLGKLSRFNRWNDMSRAFINTHSVLGVPMYYCSLSDPERIEFLEADLVAHTKNKFLEGSLHVPGHVPLPVTAPENPSEQTALQPELRLCSWFGQGVSTTIKIPPAVENKWKNHSEFGEAFDMLLKDIMAGQSVGESVSHESNGEPLLKKAKTEVKTESTSEAIEIQNASAEMQTAFNDSVRVAIPGIAGLAFVFHNDIVYLYNTSDSSLSVKHGQVLASYYRGKWVSGYTDDAASSSMDQIPFELKKCDDLIYMANEPCVLKEVIEEMRGKDPFKAKVAYHTMVDTPTPEDMSNFSLSLKYKHVWKTEAGSRPDNRDLLTASCGGWIGYKDWDTASTAVTWMMKWSSKGLAPVRPLVVATKSMTLKPKPSTAVTWMIK